MFWHRAHHDNRPSRQCLHLYYTIEFSVFANELYGFNDLTDSLMESWEKNGINGFVCKQLTKGFSSQHFLTLRPSRPQQKHYEWLKINFEFYLADAIARPYLGACNIFRPIDIQAFLREFHLKFFRNILANATLSRRQCDYERIRPVAAVVVFHRRWNCWRWFSICNLWLFILNGLMNGLLSSNAINYPHQ